MLFLCSNTVLVSSTTLPLLSQRHTNPIVWVLFGSTKPTRDNTPPGGYTYKYERILQKVSPLPHDHRIVAIILGAVSDEF